MTASLPPFAGRFTLLGIAGRGGMGVVHRAVDLQTGATVAVKVLHHGGVDSGERFLREAEVLARMTHGGIVRHVAHGATSEGHPYLVMEWLEGEDLADHLKQGPLTAEQTAHLGADIADALAFAHRHGVVHRDLKPANVYLVGNDLRELRLLDFGIARLQEGPSAATRTGTVMGTPAYMAPEQARGDRGLDGRADLFSLGCMLYECLAGRPPFVADSAMAVLIKVLLEEPPSLQELRADVPPALSQCIARLLAKDAAERPETAEWVADFLRGIDPHVIVPTADLAPIALTRNERRIVTLLVAEDPWPGEAPPAWTSPGPTRVPEDDNAATLMIQDAGLTVRAFAGGALVDLQRRLAGLGARLHRLLDGTLVATLDANWAGSQTSGPAQGEQATRAARCALLLHSALPEVAMVVATGYGVSSGEAGGEVAVGEAIEAAVRALRTLALQGRRCIAMDDATVGLLGGRFEVQRATTATGDFQWILQGDRPTETQRPSLLGQTTPCVGRGRELRVLQAVFESCAEEGGAKVLVTAPSGLGKSRLLEEFLTWLGQKRPAVQMWSIRAEAMGQESPYGLLAGLLSRVADLQSGMDDAERTVRLKARIDRAVASEQRAAVLDFAAMVLGLHAVQPSERLRAAREDAALMEDLVRDGLAAWLHAEARYSPLVVVIDDLQWSDRLTLRAIGAVHDLLNNDAILFVGLARPEALERFPLLRVDPHVLELRLGPLSRRASEQLVRAVLGPDVPPAQVDGIVELAAGEAFYLEELIRTTAAQPAGQDLQATLPTTVLAMAQARLDALDPEARRVLRAASVFGMSGWTDGVAQLAGGRVDADLERLVQAELLVHAPRSRLRSQEEISFRHAFLREAAYAMLTDADRTLGHRLAAAWLIEAGETDPIVLAAHLQAGGDAPGAVEQIALAAEQAMAGAEFDGARRLVQRGQELLAQAPAAVTAASPRGRQDGVARLQLVHAELEMLQGHSTEALEAAQAAAAGLEPGSRLWYRAVSEAARALVRSARLAEAVTMTAIFLGPPPAEDATEALVFNAARLVVNLLFADLVEDADRLLAFAEAERNREGANVGVAAVARLAGARSSRKALVGDLFGASRQTQAAFDGFAALQDMRNACAQQLDLGVMQFRMGQWALAEPLLGEAITQAERYGLLTMVAVGRLWLGAVVFEQGRRVEGLSMLRHAQVELTGQTVSLPHCWCLFQLVRANLTMGDLASAEVSSLTLLTLARPMRGAWPQANGMHARVLTAQGRNEEALQFATLACHAWNEGLRAPERGIVPWLALAEAQKANGDLASSRASAAGAWTLVTQMADFLPDPGLRETFLSAAPEHRSIAALLV